jgi:hypothetical protein
LEEASVVEPWPIVSASVLATAAPLVSRVGLVEDGKREGWGDERDWRMAVRWAASSADMARLFNIRLICWHMLATHHSLGL